MKKRIFVPSSGIDSWKALLVDQEKQWKDGYSAKELAKSWEAEPDLPYQIRRLFIESDISDFKDIQLALAIPEYKVCLPGGTRPSQNDVFALLRTNEGLSSMTVEGKAREDFDVTIGVWKKRRTPKSKGINERLKPLLEITGLINTPTIDQVRYQLLHRMASAIIEAKKFHAQNAIMLIQSFVEEDRENHYEDFENFIKCYGKISEKEKLIYLGDLEKIKLYAGWVYCSVN